MSRRRSPRWRRPRGGGKLLAGGQSLGPMLNLRLARPHLLVDVSRLQALAQVETSAAPGASAPASPMPASKMPRQARRVPRCCARWPAASPIGPSATAARSAAASPMPTRPPTGRWRWRRWAHRQYSRCRRRAPSRSSSSCSAPSPRARDDEIIESDRRAQALARRALRLLQVLPQDRRVRRSERRGAFSIRDAGRRASFSARCARCRSARGAGAARRREGEAALRQPGGRRSPRRSAISIRSSGAWRPPRSRAPCSRYSRDDADRAHRERQRKVAALVEPRTHLADFLREHCRLTGTHLGCEHGVCGACTVLIDGEPARSCIDLRGRLRRSGDRAPSKASTTIRSCSDLREAFSREHALQCGFCTPGMLIAARDIVRRLPGADEHRIRVELSGNLCRCTGYLGIVKAVRERGRSARQAGRALAGQGGRAGRAAATFDSRAIDQSDRPPAPAAAPTMTAKGWTRFEESFVIRKPPATVWTHLRTFLRSPPACLEPRWPNTMPTPRRERCR